MKSICGTFAVLMFGIAYPVLARDPGEVDQQGKASYYSDRLQEHKTASGKPVKVEAKPSDQPTPELQQEVEQAGKH
jgi:hypothetical protein